MASVVSALVGGGGGQLLGGISKVIDSIRGKSPEDAAKIQELLEKHEDAVLDAQKSLELAKINENVQLNQIASDNVKADAAGQSWFQRNDRPAIIWMGIVVIFNNYFMAFWFQNHGFKAIKLPAMLWEVWAVLATGVVMNRTVGNVLDTVLGGQGGTVKLPGGVHLESKGD